MNVSLRKTVQLQILLWIFPHSNFIKYIITFDVSNGVNVRFVHRVLCVYDTIQFPLQYLDPQFEKQVLLNLFLGVYDGSNPPPLDYISSALIAELYECDTFQLIVWDAHSGAIDIFICKD